MRNIINTIYLIFTLTACNEQTVNYSNDSPNSSSNFYDQFDYGKQLMLEKKYDQALIIFSDQIRLHPTRAALYIQRALVYSEINEHDSAIADMNTVLTFNTHDISSLFLRGQLKYGGGYFDEAIVDFDSVIANRPDFTGVYLNKGFALLKLNKRQMACDFFSQALNSGDSNAQASLDKYCK